MKRSPNPRTTLSRRTVLRGLAGTTAVMVGLPLLDSMLDNHGEALADGGPIPRRLVTWFFGNGVLLNRWIPGGIRNPVTGAAYPLSEELQPLVNVKDYVSVLSGFHNKCKYLITHHEGMSIWNGYTMADKGQGPGFFSNARGPTIDQIYASYIAAQPGTKPAILNGVHCGVVSQISQADYGTTMHNVSHSGYLSPNPPIKNAQTIHQQFVDLFTPPDDPSKPSRLAVVDTVLADAKELKKKLGMADQLRVDGHLAGLADLQNKISSIAPLCQLPGQPSVQTDVTDGIVAMNQAVSDLIAFAFSCDVTRIASNLFVGGASEAPLLSGKGSQHALSHSVSANYLPYGGQTWDPSDPVNAPAITENGPIADYNGGIVFTMQNLAYFLEKLKNTPDAGGTNLLDNSVVLVSSDCSDGWSHNIRDQPLLVCGKAGGALKYPGLHHRATNQRRAQDVTLTVLQAVMPTVTELGSNAYQLDGVTDPCYTTTMVDEIRV